MNAIRAFAVVVMMLGSAPASAASPLTNEQMATIDHVAAAFVLVIECETFRRNSDTLAELYSSSGLVGEGENAEANAYMAMRLEIEMSQRRRVGAGEYCATGWWRYGDNGVVVAGLITRPPPLEEQAPLSVEQKRLLDIYAFAHAADAQCSQLKSDLKAMLALVRDAKLPHGHGKDTRARDYLDRRLRAEISRMDDVGKDAFCDEALARLGASGTDAAGLLRKRE